METNNIPKSFWHALSICMIATTAVLLFIAAKSSTVSIEIANTKIELSSALAQTREIKQQLIEENKRLQEADQQRIKQLETLTASLPAAVNSPTLTLPQGEIEKYVEMLDPNSPTHQLHISEEWFNTLDTRINTAEQALKK